jgi:hypothetical protein
MSRREARRVAFRPSNWATDTNTEKFRSNLELTPTVMREAVSEGYAASWEFKAPARKTGFGLDIAVEPRTSVNKTKQHESRRTGAEVRLGQMADKLDQRGTNKRVDNWYMFVGTDNEALVWDVGDKGLNFGGVALRDQLTVGDIQAGVAFTEAVANCLLGICVVRQNLITSGMLVTLLAYLLQCRDNTNKIPEFWRLMTSSMGRFLF